MTTENRDRGVSRSLFRGTPGRATDADLRREVDVREAVLDSLPAHIALLDGDGNILAVNASWKRFATSNVLANRDYGIGQNYITICERATGKHADEACEVATGIRRVLDGEIPVFSLEYPCHSPEERRWFRLMVTPMEVEGAKGAVVMHLNITERKLAEIELREHEALLRIASHTARLGGWTVTLPDFHMVWSEETARIHDEPRGFCPSVEQGILYYAPEYREQVREAFRRCVEDGIPFDVEAEIVTARGTRKWVRTIGEAVRDKDGRIVQVEGGFQDISEHKELERTVEASNARFRQLADAMPMIVWTAAPDGRVDYVNRHSFEFTGVSLEASPAASWQGTLHPEDRDRCLAAWERAVRSETTFEIEYRIRRGSDGTYRWFRVQALPIRDESGNLVKWYGTAVDVDATKRMEAESRELARRYTTTLESITDAFFTLDLEWRFTFLNSEAERLLDRKRDALIGRNVWAEFSAAVGSTFEKEYYRAMREKVTVAFEEYYPPLERWFSVRAYPSEQGLAVYFRDVTLTRKKEEKLREQAALLDQARDAIFVCDLEHRVLYWNLSAERLYGWTAEEAEGRRLDDLVYRTPAELEQPVRTTREKGEWVGEVDQFSRDGTALSVEGRWTLMRDEDGEPRSILAINTDVTERNKLEVQFRRAQRMESIGTLAGGIAHDLNNLFAPIVMGIDLLREFELNDDARAVIEAIEQSTQRGVGLVKQVLGFARGIEGARMPLHLEKIVREIESIIGNSFPKNITLECEIPDDLWMVMADPNQMNQVILNLCVNSRDAMPDGGTLSIRLHNVVLDEVYSGMDPQSKSGAHVVITIEDTGAGIPREIQEKIFDPFFTTKEIGKGTGLGLVTVQNIVKNHGGFLDLYCEAGKGTRFKVYLPAEAEESFEGVPDVEPEQPARGQGEMILVVDDEASIRTLAQKTLEQFGYRVVLAANGAEAVALYARHGKAISVVLTDMAMPVMDGSATIVALKAIDPEVKIIASSGYAATEVAGKAVGAGVHHFIPKPYTAEILLNEIRSVLAEGTS